MFKPDNRKPDFSNLAAVLECKCPKRPTLFEFYMNDRIDAKLLSCIEGIEKANNFEKAVLKYMSAGYDYATVWASTFGFPTNKYDTLNTHSLDDGAIIFDRESFDKYRKNFLSPDEYDMTDMENSEKYVPDGMKLMVAGPGGILENVISLVGYSNLCIMLYEDEQLVWDVFELVGENMLRYYEKSVVFDTVGCIMSNDDWGFNTQTMLSPEDMRKFVFPWHKKIVELAHSKGKYALLHSCGNYDKIIDDVIYDMKFDGRHSYQDTIVPVEDAYEQLKGKIAVLGGIDIDFMARRTAKEVYDRSKAMFERSSKDGGYALGTGNSVPEYIPDENYFAMLKAAFE